MNKKLGAHADSERAAGLRLSRNRKSLLAERRKQVFGFISYLNPCLVIIISVLCTLEGGRLIDFSWAV